MTSVADIVASGTPVIRGGVIHMGPTQPVAAMDGDVWVDTANQVIYSRVGGQWVAFAIGGGGGNLPAPIKEGDIIYADIGLQWQVGAFESGRW